MSALRLMMREKTDAALAKFCNTLYDIGVMPKKDGFGAYLDPEEARKVLRQGGKLPTAVLFAYKFS